MASTDSQAFLEVNEAYSVLIDPEQRRVYDGNRGISQTQPYRGDETDDFQTPHFSCTPHGPKMSFNRASEIFHSRKFRRKYAAPGFIWREPGTTSFRDEVEEMYEREKHYYDYYNRRTLYRPSIITLLIFFLGTFVAVVVSYKS